jgi:acetyl-CoA carboxylase/biotin carboxylase 1
VLELVVSHQGRALKMDLLRRLMATLVLPAPEHYRDYLRRMAALPAKGTADIAQRAQQLLEHSLLADLRAVVARVGVRAGGEVWEWLGLRLGDCQDLAAQRV